MSLKTKKVKGILTRQAREVGVSDWIDFYPGAKRKDVVRIGGFWSTTKESEKNQLWSGLKNFRKDYPKQKVPRKGHWLECSLEVLS